MITAYALFTCFFSFSAYGMEQPTATHEEVHIIFTLAELQAENLLTELQKLTPELIEKAERDRIARHCALEILNATQYQDLLPFVIRSDVLKTPCALVAVAHGIDCALFEALIEHGAKDTHLFGSVARGPQKTAFSRKRAYRATGIALSANGSRHASIYTYSDGQKQLCLGEKEKIFGIEIDDLCMVEPYFTREGACIIATARGLISLSQETLTSAITDKKLAIKSFKNAPLLGKSYTAYGPIFQIARDIVALQISETGLLLHNSQKAESIDFKSPGIITSDGQGSLCIASMDDEISLCTLNQNNGELQLGDTCTFKKNLRNPTQIIFKTMEPGVSYIVITGGISNKNFELIAVERTTATPLLQKSYMLSNEESITKIFWPDFGDKPLIITDSLNTVHVINTKAFRYLALSAFYQRAPSKKRKELEFQ